MTRGEELSQIRRGLAGMKSDINRFVETVQQSIAQAEERLDAMAAEATKPGPLESTEVRPDFFSKNEPTTFEERVGGLVDDARSWGLLYDDETRTWIIREAGVKSVVATSRFRVESEFIVNIANNWDRIVELIEAARRVVGNAERMKDPNAGVGLVLALAALDAAEVVK